MEQKLAQLKTRLAEIDALNSAEAILYWDQSTYMPPGGAHARAAHSAIIGRIAHEKKTDPDLGKLLEDLQEYEQSLESDSDTASLIRVTRQEFDRAIKIPPSFMSDFHNHMAETYDAWSKARPANDFEIVRPHLERGLELTHRYVEYFPERDHIADPLIEQEDYGMKTATVLELFGKLREKLVPLVKAIGEQEEIDDTPLKKNYDENKQIEFGEKVIKKMGYDFSRGRQDKTLHPYMIKFSIDDVRITTRGKAKELGEGFFSTMHEAGHALYEQNVNKEYEGTPLANGTSMGVHESQSRLWENIIGRSYAFWQAFYPELQESFPELLKEVFLDDFYRMINKVKPSLIRTEADEVTYNLHVMIRFDLEISLLEGKLSIKDLPDAWCDRYQSDLGIRPASHRDGVMQDVHWYQWLLGGVFQGYTLGNIMSAQFYHAALKAHPNITDDIARGNFDDLSGWLRENIYRHGKKYTAVELISRTTGEEMTIDPYIDYLTKKYTQIYCL